MINNIKFEYPLQWLPQQSRTKRPCHSQFRGHSISVASNNLIYELGLMKAEQCLISCNLKQRLDGRGFYAIQNIEDTGIVVYFKLKGKSKAMACDKYRKVEDNLWALYKSVQAIRGLERWGGSEFLDGLFTGFTALPETIIVSEVNYFKDIKGQEELRLKYKELAKKLHPDMFEGSEEEFQIMSRQYNQRKERG